MELLQHEEYILSSNEEKLILTNYRIQLKEKTQGLDNRVIIFLEDISSIQLTQKTNKLYLLIGVLGLVTGLILKTIFNFDLNTPLLETATIIQRNSLTSTCFIVGIVFLLLYWIFYIDIISIRSSGGMALEFEIKELQKSDLDNFLNKLQQAKFYRLNNLRR